MPLLKIIPPEIAKYNGSDKVFKFINGSTIRFGYCQREMESFRYQGDEYDVIGFEEATHFTELTVQQITASLRNTRKDFSPRVYYTSNPGGVGHAWFKRLFVDKQYKDTENAEDYIFFPARVTDNPSIMDNDPEYINRLKNLPDGIRKAWLEGSWDVYEGQYFPEFDRDKHTVEPFNIPTYWKRIMAFDYGQDMTACLWGAISPDGEIYIYRELYEPNLIISEAAKAILKATPKDEKIYMKIASPDLWNRRQESGVSGVHIMQENRLYGLIKANNERVAGWRAIKEKMHYTDTTLPKLRIFKNCINLIRCLPLLQYDVHNAEDVASTPHEITHAPEALRYMIMSIIGNPNNNSFIMRSYVNNTIPI